MALVDVLLAFIVVKFVFISGSLIIPVNCL